MVETINAVTPAEEARATLASSYDLTFTKAVERVTAPLRERVKAVLPDADWPRLAPLIVQINRLKREKRVPIFAHRNQSVPLYHGVADVTGDTIELAMQAAKARGRTVIVCGALFVAETTKLLSPRKTVLTPDGLAIDPLSTSITPDDVLAIKAQYPGVPVIASINSSVAVKAVSDVCCTSANALAIVESQPGDRVVLVPDQYLARNLAKRTTKKVITWSGTRAELKDLTTQRVADLRQAHPKARVIAHPSCPPDVVEAADFSGSTSQMLGWLEREAPPEVAMLADPAAVDNAAVAFPRTTFVPTGLVASQPQRITLESLLWSLHSLAEPVTIRDDVAAPAGTALQRMLKVAGPAT